MRLDYEREDLDLGYHQEGEADIHSTVHVLQASDAAVQMVLGAPVEDSIDGIERSEWLWVRFPNGDLMLATFPQDELYFATETDHSR